MVSRVEMLWGSMRGKVLVAFPKGPGLPTDKEAYLRFVDEIYRTDAYHSLSIEGYSVNPALVERVRQGGWDPQHDAGDRRNRDALAARGYWQAFQLVKKEVEKVIAGENPAALARAAHNDWYRELFQPCVTAGLLEPGSLAGYRNIPVYLRGRATFRRGGRRCATPCRRSSIFWRKNPRFRCARCWDTGFSVISTHTRMATAAWRASS